MTVIKKPDTITNVILIVLLVQSVFHEGIRATKVSASGSESDETQEVVELEDCSFEMDPVVQGELINAAEKCYNWSRSGEEYEHYPEPDVPLEDFDFDDHCETHCFYQQMDMLTPEGEVAEEGSSKLLTWWNLTENVANNLRAIWENCTRETERLSKERNFGPCKSAGLHEFCISKRMYYEDDVFKDC